ncbi:MAG: asparagine synthase (glutamine-hydrolyzing) [Burkholderiaceae bacterium]|nr:MAG: asparagine synthase (glutamine-hydrolyzing) [Burkholderiaceae bacterium]TAM09126.1 MAG: asparagine synthase (glutamine-hydrolyzing) [Pusillimonas sp.]
MCGIIGVWGPLPNRRSAIRQGCHSLRHRGPDSHGYWEDPSADLALGHVRLAIVDISAAGNQPMVSESGRYVLVLNGEIYNHLRLRERLQEQGKAPAWRGHSDTETLLAALVAWGMEATLKAAVGMFAMALWDRQERTLSLARDRLGEKPLYLGFAEKAFVFGSEIKAFARIPGLSKELDRGALALLMRHNYIPAPHSIYRDVKKLLPGTWLVLTEADRLQRRMPESHVYWSAYDEAVRGNAQPLSFGSDRQALEALEKILASAVKGQMMADVPLGAFLSGGVDSSIIVALMQVQSSPAVSTFSIGFHEKDFNEAEHAKAVANHLGTRHTELYVTPDDALAVVPQLASLYDEPFADASQVPTALVMRMARRNVTVAISGDGGDEMFGGYSRYFRAARWWAKREVLPAGLHKPVAVLGRATAGLLPRGHNKEQFSKLADVASAATASLFYRQFVSYWKDPAQVVIGAQLPPTVFDKTSTLPFFENMMRLDAESYLPDDILVKVDRAAMAVGLETRVPFIDHRVFEFAQCLPLDYKVRDGQGKWLLRQLLYKYVPRELVDRPKKGFGVPLAAWLRGPLKDWAAALLDEHRLRSEGVFHAQPISERWREHLSGERDWSTHLWSILMTQAWLDQTRTSTRDEVVEAS